MVFLLHFHYYTWESELSPAEQKLSVSWGVNCGCVRACVYMCVFMCVCTHVHVTTPSSLLTAALTCPHVDQQSQSSLRAVPSCGGRDTHVRPRVQDTAVLWSALQALKVMNWQKHRVSLCVKCRLSYNSKPA